VNIVPFELASQADAVVAALARGAVIIGLVEAGDRVGIAGALIAERDALEEATAVGRRERDRGEQRVRQRHVDRAAHLHQIVAADRHVTARAEILARIVRHDGNSAADGIAAEQGALRPLEHLDALYIGKVLVRADRAGEIDAVQIDADARIDVEGEIVGTDAADRRRQDCRRA
jgi:hypothetical protein